MNTNKKSNRTTLTLSQNFAPHLETLKRYSEATGIPMDALIDQALEQLH